MQEGDYCVEYTINCLIVLFHSFHIRCPTDTVISVGDVRKISNGCEVAKRVPKTESGFRISSGNIAAIDFGTTNCSVAYTTVGSGPEEVPRRLPLNSTHYCVPTSLDRLHIHSHPVRSRVTNLWGGTRGPKP